MSGHSKWANIKYRKERADAQKGKIFSQLSKAITSAAKSGSSSALEKVVAQAKAANMPKANIERAINKQSQKDNLEEIIYEIISSFDIGILITVATDNKSRTLAEIKQILKKHNAQLGNVAWMFEGQKAKYPIALNSEQKQKINKLLEDLKSQDDVQEVYSNLA